MRIIINICEAFDVSYMTGIVAEGIVGFEAYAGRGFAAASILQKYVKPHKFSLSMIKKRRIMQHIF